MKKFLRESDGWLLKLALGEESARYRWRFRKGKEPKKKDTVQARKELSATDTAEEEAFRLQFLSKFHLLYIERRFFVENDESLFRNAESRKLKN